MIPTIRPVTPDDWQLVRSIRLAALADAPYAFSATLESEGEQDDAFWKQRVADNAAGQTSTCLLALDGERPAGMAVGLRDEQDATLSYLVAMWVAPDDRGGPTASALVSGVAEWAAAGGATMLVAGVTRDNARAARAYRKLGFGDGPALPPGGPATSGCETVLALRLGG